MDRKAFLITHGFLHCGQFSARENVSLDTINVFNDMRYGNLSSILNLIDNLARYQSQE